MFKTKSGIEIPGVSKTELLRLRSDLTSTYGISSAQLVEAASYSMAMVVRFALGLSAQGGKVGCIFADTLTGWIALATARHLVNGGSDVQLIYIGDPDNTSPDLDLQILPFEKTGHAVTLWNSSDDNRAIAQILSDCHNSLCGYVDISKAQENFQREINELLNELSTPIYAIDCPAGVDPDTGKSMGSPLYASCTLAIGAPLKGLGGENDYVGRLYVCDISIPRQLYSTADMDLTSVFADQPVQQISPI